VRGFRDLLDRGKARSRLRLGKVALVHSRDFAITSAARGRPLHDPLRGARALRKLFADRLLRRGDVRSPRPARWDQLAEFHTASWLERCWRPEVLAPIFGAAPEDLAIDDILDAARAAVGGTVLAARLARLGAEVVVNLGGGFHHAEPDRGGGYCVFNDVGVAIRHLRADGFGGRIAVVDLDLHQGNGTARGFEADESVFTFSMHRTTLAVAAKKANLDVEVPERLDDGGYMTRLREHLPRVFAEHRPELVFYVAGADVIEGDAIGDLALSELGVARRDQYVLEQARRVGAPVVAVLAGGYGDHAWRVAYRLARLALTGRVFERDVVDPTVAWFREAAGRIQPHELQAEDDASWEISEDDLDLKAGPAARGRLFLGYYSRTGLDRAFEHYGFFARLRRKGFRGLRVEMDLSDRARQTIRVLGRKEDAGPELTLIELIAGIRELPWPDGKPLRLLSIEWLSLQDPSAQFDAARTRLPLQKHPGLGLAREVMLLFERAVERLGLDGIVQSAAHFHGAVLLGTRDALFVDPVIEGRFRALRRALADLRLADSTALIERGAIRELPGGTAVQWVGADQLVPLSPRAKALFESEQWRSAMVDAERSASYQL
jgi:acetoin utilization deacetylase AcuC-like enzyme